MGEQKTLGIDAVQDAVSVKVEGIEYAVQDEAVLSVAGFIDQVEERNWCTMKKMCVYH